MKRYPAKIQVETSRLRLQKCRPRAKSEKKRKNKKRYFFSFSHILHCEFYSFIVQKTMKMYICSSIILEEKVAFSFYHPIQLFLLLPFFFPILFSATAVSKVCVIPAHKRLSSVLNKDISIQNSFYILT